MSYFTSMISLKESSSSNYFPEDISGFNEEDTCFGCDKVSIPSKEGMAAAFDAMDSFANASDGQDTDINLSFQLSEADNSGFEKDASLELFESDEEFADTVTTPSYSNEDDQISEYDDNEYNRNIPADQLANDEDEMVEESVTGWNDLF